MVVMSESFDDAVLVLVGHGSTKDGDSSAPVYQHARELRQRRIFAEVLEAFWKQEPHIKTVVDGIVAPRLFLVPLFISEGYFASEAIPRLLDLPAPGPSQKAGVRRREKQTLYYSPPVGTHERMTEVVLSRAKEVVERHPFPVVPKPAEITLFIAGHGTTQNENSRVSIEHQVDVIRQLHEYAAVLPLFLEEEPRVLECYRLAQTRNIVIVPFFISDGMHTKEDIPLLLGEPKQLVKQRLEAGQATWRNPTERYGKRVWYSPGVGGDPRVAEVVLERVREMAAEQ